MPPFDYTKIGVSLQEHIATLVPAFEAAERNESQEHLLYEPWNLALSWLTFGQSTPTCRLSVAPQRHFYFNFSPVPSLSANPMSAKLLSVQAIRVACTRWQIIDGTDADVLASGSVGHAAAVDNNKILSSTLSSLLTLTISSRAASVALSQSSDHSNVDRDSYRIPDFAILSRTGHEEQLQEQVPFIIEVKTHTTNQLPDDQFLIMLTQVAYQAKAVFSAYPQQEHLHAICVVGRYYKILHLNQATIAGVP
ncbi:hypothetical protein SERLA73DRAFT_75767 [Serpula lacrymans var. lacrymans S7.3]|uniref:Uncharacterized protein n=2 Tax=Serpula lacrymans var. lacrymans TaxID=341189 RepID=F8Q464_SERL3|nr:uncharacterized protein SERLADRAFT_440535 [Serpula lacrymans var. lacrymans S7.9]EGN96920.1 hypothetical protein SERLA73DRAFT_75767 [Serpula lacrymans var. lacrymans S7.3]EGO22513.1 hypothetical protein SERLADRAFT_440535 [Serpula lacrymans var. lacrymans S7.9]